jgi:hypothetical protein
MKIFKKDKEEKEICSRSNNDGKGTMTGWQDPRLGPGRFNQNFFTLQIPLKEGTRQGGGETRPKDRVKDRVTLWITLSVYFFN